MDLNEDLVLRIRSDGVVVSTDDGESLTFGRAEAAQVRDLLQTFATGERTLRSAALLASIAEARSVRPSRGPKLVPRRDSEPPVTEEGVVDIGARAGEPGIASLLRLRRSERPSRSCGIAQLATLLFHSARTIDEWISDDGMRLAHRPYPSAGARHPIGITVVAQDVEGLARGAWVFDSVRCRLVPCRWSVETSIRLVDSATAALGGVVPPALIVAVAEPDRTATRYRGATAHLWRDAGAMLATVHLAAAGMGLRSTIVGIGGQIGDEADDSIDVGGVAVGN